MELVNELSEDEKRKNLTALNKKEDEKKKLIELFCRFYAPLFLRKTLRLSKR